MSKQTADIQDFIYRGVEAQKAVDAAVNASPAPVPTQGAFTCKKLNRETWCCDYLGCDGVLFSIWKARVMILRFGMQPAQALAQVRVCQRHDRIFDQSHLEDEFRLATFEELLAAEREDLS